MQLPVPENTFTLDAGGSIQQGNRFGPGTDKVEDRAVIVPFAQYFNQDKKVETDTFFGVYDGHAGYDVSEYLVKNLHCMVAEHLTSEKNIELAVEALQGCYSMADEFIEKNNIFGGSTAVTALVLDSTLYIANTGDSRAVIYKDNGEIWSTKDHKPNDDGPCPKIGERDRIKREEGFVVNCGRLDFPVWRLGGCLTMSRAIGDYYNVKGLPKPKGLIAVPDVDEFVLNSSHKFMILASDGVWDMLTHEKAVQLVINAFKAGQTAHQVARILIETACSFGSSDDLTAIVVKFNWS